VAGDGASYDVIHSHYWLSGIIGERLKAAWHVPHVVMFHTLGEVKNRASLSEHETDLRIEAEGRIIRGVDRVICATEAERALIEQLYSADAGKIEVIPLGVDLDRFRPLGKDDARKQLSIGDDEHIVLFVGRIELLLENEPLRRNLGEAAREAVARYRWENVAGSIIDLYNELTGRETERDE
jgi:D-inositol-3-phosphate glycosyltransferase